MSEDTTFGEWIRQRRKAFDLTQDDLADRIGCSPETIRKIEGGRRRPSRQVAVLLAAQLKVTPEEQDAFMQFARVEADKYPLVELPSLRDPMPGATPKHQEDLAPYLPVYPPDMPFPNNLPQQLTSFIGRKRELAEVQRLLATARLLTLTGAGGCGKTRLAIQAGIESLKEYTNGVWLVNLERLADPGLVPQTVASVFELREESASALVNSLVDHLRPLKLLLILDNCEQVAGGCRAVVEVLLATCSNLRILTTSREALHFYGEQEFPVPPLAVPDPRHLPPSKELSQCEAVNLFTQRAVNAKPDFVLTDRNAQVVAEICYSLDGLPLAIELAAARIKLLSPQVMLTQMSSRLKLLSGGARNLPVRHQTLRAAISWSYDLLGSEEQKLFSRLAVFVGGSTLEAIEAVCYAGGDLSIDILDGLGALVDKNLLRREEGAGGELRFWMHVTLREYALEQLERNGEAESVRRHHMRFFVELAERAAGELRGPDQVGWLGLLEAERDNFRAALQWGTRTDHDIDVSERTLRLATALQRFWEIRGPLVEGRAWLDAVLDRRGAADPHLLAKALTGAGTIAFRQGDYLPATECHQNALDLYRELRDMQGIAFATNNIGVQAYCLDDTQRAEDLFEESLALYRQLGDKPGLSMVLNNLGEVVRLQNYYDRAQVLYEECAVIRKELGDKYGLAITLMNLGYVTQQQNNYERAKELFLETLAILLELGDEVQIAVCLAGLGGVVGAQGQLKRAVQLFGASQELLKVAGSTLTSGDRMDLERSVAHIRSQMGETEFAAAWAEGQSLSVEGAIALVLPAALDPDIVGVAGSDRS